MKKTSKCLFDVCLSVHRCLCVEKKNQLDATDWFIALIICSTCYGHLYSHHQELQTILVLLPHMVYNVLVAVVGVQVQGSRLCVQDEGNCSHNFPHPGLIACCSASNSRTPATKALHTICSNNRSIVWSSWWWAYKCPKQVEQIISAINHSVASSWFFFSTHK